MHVVEQRSYLSCGFSSRWMYFSLSLSLSRFPPFLKSLDERSLDENERPRRRSSPSLPPSLCQSQGSTSRREGWWDICTEWKIFLRVLVYMPADFSRDSSFDIWPVEKCTRKGEWDDYHRGKGRNFKVNVELRGRQNDYDETWNVSVGRR